MPDTPPDSSTVFDASLDSPGPSLRNTGINDGNEGSLVSPPTHSPESRPDSPHSAPLSPDERPSTRPPDYTSDLQTKSSAVALSEAGISEPQTLRAETPPFSLESFQSPSRPLPSLPPTRARSSSDPPVSSVTAADRIAGNLRPTPVIQLAGPVESETASHDKEGYTLGALARDSLELFQSRLRPPSSLPRTRPRSGSDPPISSVTAADRIAGNPRPTSVIQLAESVESETAYHDEEERMLGSLAKDPEPEEILAEEFHEPGSAFNIVSNVVTGPPPVYAVTDRDARLDRLGEELAPDSSVWLTYVASASAHDKEMVDGWNKSLDVLLIFASLFSAVVTTFAIESSHSLQPDYNQVTALLTAQVLKALTNTGNSSYLNSLPSAEQILSFTKPRTSTSVNVLWYSALGFSLSSVLVAMLAKQWLAAYDSQSQDEPLEASCERQRKFDGLHKWSLPYILAILPALLHVSLFLFLAGLIMYLWNLDVVVSGITCVILGLLFMFYFTSGILAVFAPNCPYKTPLSEFIHSRIWGKHNSKGSPGDPLIPKAVMWLANADDPKTVSAALQSLAGLRRGFVGYKGEQVEYLARITFDRLRTCFITEWRHSGTYSLRTEEQYKASCYLRTLMHFVDDSRNTNPSRFTAILADPALPTFMKLLGDCTERSIALLALCDYQRFLHRTELDKWLSVRDLGSPDDVRTPAQSVHHEEATANMMKVILLLNDYIKGRNFLHPFAVEVAVETIGYAPLAWVVNFSKKDPLNDCLAPLVRLLRLTRGGGVGVRRALSRTFSILYQIQAIPLLPNLEEDFVVRFEHALSIISAVETSDGSDNAVREMILLALSQFLVTFEPQNVLVENFCEEFFYECDRRISIEQVPFHDNTAVTALLPLLLAPSLSHEQKATAITKLYANAISAVEEIDPAQNNISLPLDAFPSDSVPFLIRTLDTFRGNTHSWLGDTSILLYVISRGLMHRQTLLAQAHTLILIVETTMLEEVANRLFWILTSLLWDAVGSSDENTIQTLMSAGIVNMFNAYSEKYGLTPADVHAWVDILALPRDACETLSRRELTQRLCSRFEDQNEERLQHLHRLREPIFQFSYQYSTAYTPDSALEALRALREAYADTPDTSQERPASTPQPVDPTLPNLPPAQEGPQNGTQSESHATDHHLDVEVAETPDQRSSHGDPQQSD